MLIGDRVEVVNALSPLAACAFATPSFGQAQRYWKEFRRRLQ